MHWTALIARRHLAPHAQVIDDLPCIGCGYNLRGLLASGACPECGLEIGESMFRLKHPERAAASLRTIGRSFLAPALLLLLPVLGGLLGVVWLVFGGMALAALLRVIAAGELRFRCGIERLPVIGTRATAFWWFAVLDTIVAAATLVMFYIALTVPPGSAMETAFGWTLAGAAVSWTVLALVGGHMGYALAGLLGWELMERDFRRQRLLVLVALGIVALAALLAAAVQSFGGSAVGSGIIVRIGRYGFVIAAALVMIFTVLGFLHLAAAAERDRDKRDDVLASPDEEAAAPPPRPGAVAEDLPEIPLDGE